MENVTEQRPTKMKPLSEVTGEFYSVMVHGGLGDCLWALGKKLVHLPAPLYVCVANENRHRPRRVGRLLDHLPNIAGWDYIDRSFAPTGDWTTSAQDPACAIGKTWADLKWRPNTQSPYRIECNRWLEGGNRIEGWLPDLPTTHRVAWADAGPPTAQFRRPLVVFHIAGWPDIPDSNWITGIRLMRGVAQVCIVGGSYDHRPRNVYREFERADDVSLLEDVSWENLFGVLKSCDYCFGHASGFTAIADTLGVHGATYNPHSVPKLIGTWNDRSNEGMVHIDRVADFDKALHTAYQKLAAHPCATWPPTSIRGSAISADTKNRGVDAAAVYAASIVALPRQAVFVFDATPPDKHVASACVDAVLDSGEQIQSVTLAGAPPTVIAALYATSARTTRRPVIDTPADPRAVLERPITYGLSVVYTGADRNQALRSAAWGWGHTSAGGTMLVGGESAEQAILYVAGAKNTTASRVGNAPGWWYLHRRS